MKNFLSYILIDYRTVLIKLFQMPGCAILWTARALQQMMMSAEINSMDRNGLATERINTCNSHKETSALHSSQGQHLWPVRSQLVRWKPEGLTFTSVILLVAQLAYMANMIGISKATSKVRGKQCPHVGLSSIGCLCMPVETLYGR